MIGLKSIEVLPEQSGKLIVFEGVEGCGKTTQIQATLEWLKTIYPHKRVVVTREPGGTHLGTWVRRLLLEYSTDAPIANAAELLLFAADRAQHVEEVLLPELKGGSIILCDRYTDSTVAYQGYGRGLDQSLIHQLNAIATGGLKSDLTIWLDVDVEVSIARKTEIIADRIESNAIAFHRRVQKGYTKLAAQQPDQIMRIDASLNPAAVSAQIQAILRQHIV